MEGALTYDESELPEEVTYGVRGGISYKRTDGSAFNIDVNGGLSQNSKERFLEIMGNHPERLKIDFTRKLE